MKQEAASVVLSPADVGVIVPQGGLASLSGAPLASQAHPAQQQLLLTLLQDVATLVSPVTRHPGPSPTPPLACTMQHLLVGVPVSPFGHLDRCQCDPFKIQLKSSHVSVYSKTFRWLPTNPKRTCKLPPCGQNPPQPSPPAHPPSSLPCCPRARRFIDPSLYSVSQNAKPGPQPGMLLP